MVPTCSHCQSELSRGETFCPQCHEPISALEFFRQQALSFERQRNLDGAQQSWREALQYLPADSSEANWIRRHLEALQAKPQPPQEQSNAWAKRLGPLAPLALLLVKAKAIFFALFKLKFLFSFAAFLAVYWALFGAWFGIGFAVMILLHEMGHFLEVKRRRLPAEMPVFLPGLGAYVKWQSLGISTEVRALVSLAGPAMGLLAAIACAVLAAHTHRPVWAALAHTGAWLNLLNLIPVWVLDGAGAVEPLDRFGRMSLMVFSGLLFWWTGEFMLLLLVAGFAWQLFRKSIPAQGSVAVQLYFAGLLAALTWLLHTTPLARG